MLHVYVWEEAILTAADAGLNEEVSSSYSFSGY